MFQYTDIFESPCIETQKFKNFCVLYTDIFESPCIESQRFKNVCVLYTEIFEKKFNNMPLHTLVIDFLQEKFEIRTFFFNLRVLYMGIITLKAYNSAKKKQLTEIFLDVNHGTKYYRFMKKTIHGCFTHLRIVHHTDGPAWMNHLTNCPL